MLRCLKKGDSDQTSDSSKVRWPARLRSGWKNENVVHCQNVTASSGHDRVAVGTYDRNERGMTFNEGGGPGFR